MYEMYSLYIFFKVYLYNHMHAVVFYYDIFYDNI